MKLTISLKYIIKYDVLCCIQHNFLLNFFCFKQGFRLVLADECWHSSMNPVMDDVRKQIGKAPVYVSLDIDALDPAFAPGTGNKLNHHYG